MGKSPLGEEENLKESADVRTLGVRVLAGAILVPLVLVITHIGGLTFVLFVGLLAGLGYYEFYKMFSRTGAHPSGILGIAGSVCVCISFQLGASDVAGLILTAFLGAVLVERIIRRDREGYVLNTGITILGLLYTGWLLGYFILLRSFDQPVKLLGISSGHELRRSFVYLVLILTWSYDSIAYVVGSSLGRHKLFGRVSPSKTVEGTAAGLCACVLAALISGATFASYLSIGRAIFVGVFIGVVAQIGDLVESMIKRSTGAKDSSNLIPGHGGLLDRFDSLLFTGPAFYFYLRALV